MLASIGVDRMLMLVMALMRLSSGVVGAVVALVGMAAPARPAWVVTGALLVLAWSVLFTVDMLRAGARPALLWTDVAVVVVLVLAHRWLVPAQIREVTAGTGWVDILAGTGAIIAQFGLRQPVALVAGFGIAAAYAVGDGQFRDAPLHIAAQAVVAAGMVTLLRRSVAEADSAFVELADQRQAAIVRAAVRSDERDHQRQVHDTALATLTMVHTGAIASDSVALRQRAAEDLTVIEGLRAHPAADREAARPVVRLDLMLRTAVRRPQSGDRRLDVSVDVTPIELPDEVATAISQCVAEALTNVARHAETGEAYLSGRAEGEGASIIVSDNGAGFDVRSVPPHRRGLRESISGRMRSVGGSASVKSGSGSGTEIVLRWPDA